MINIVWPLVSPESTDVWPSVVSKLQDRERIKNERLPDCNNLKISNGH